MDASGLSRLCMEVARNLPGLVAVRDSKEPDGTKLTVSEGDLADLHPERMRLANPSTASSAAGDRQASAYHSPAGSGLRN
jgi:hypothetical protein